MTTEHVPQETTRGMLIMEAARTMVRADEVDPEGGRTFAEWEAVNREGWTLDLTTALDHYERHEGVILSPRELRRAYRTAQRLLAGQRR